MKINQGAEKDRIEAGTNACLSSGQKLAARIEWANASLLAELRGTLEAPEKLFQLAVGEAEALAWQTGYPHLLFPALAMEKVRAAAGWNAQQQFIRQKNSARAMSN